MKLKCFSNLSPSKYTHRWVCFALNLNKFSTVVTSPRPAFQECTGSCCVNVPAPKVVSSQSVIDRWSNCIGQDRDSCHLRTPLCVYLAGKFDISQHLAIPRFPRVTILSTSPVQTPVHCIVKHSRPTDLKSSSNVSLPFARITGPRKQTQLALNLFHELAFEMYN
jgi:hypothetical protein